MSTIAARALPELSFPKLGFVGLGWIGNLRMQSIVAANAGIVAAVADPIAARAQIAAADAPGAVIVENIDALLQLDLDGVVIATPNALHAEQAIRVLDSGVAVFCQKPLGRDCNETRSVIEAARTNNRLLGVDLSYRFTTSAQCVRQLIHGGQLGAIYATDLTFHNAYGPEPEWFYQRASSGGGCVIDLGIHLIDLALWLLGPAEVSVVHSRLLQQGKPLQDDDAVEDYAVATLELSTGVIVRLACSWRSPAGQDAVIEASFYGTNGGASVRNVNGSFYDLVAFRQRGTQRQVIAEPPDEWGGRAAIAWAQRLAVSAAYDATIEELIPVAQTIDRMYGR